MTTYHTFRGTKVGYKAAFTLVELLVAITIAAVLTVVALPRVREGLQQNVSARSATLVKGTFENARAQAIRTGRPYGVRLHRVTSGVSMGDSVNDPLLDPSHGANYCKQISYVQMALDYRGDEETSTLISRGGNASIPSYFFDAQDTVAGLLFAVAANKIPVGQRPIDKGSTVQIGPNKVQFVVKRIYPSPLSPSNTARIEVTPVYPMRTGLVAPTTDDASIFSIETLPVASPLPPVDLPGKVAIDLVSSGTAQNPILFSPRSILGTASAPPTLQSGNSGYHDVIVMFSPSGQVDSVYVDTLEDVSTSTFVFKRVEPLGSISFLIGEIDGVVRADTIGRYPFDRPGSNGTVPAIAPTFNHTGRKVPNFANANATWVSINPMSGKTFLHGVVTPFSATDISMEVAAHPELQVAHTADILIRDRLHDSRRLVRGQL